MTANEAQIEYWNKNGGPNWSQFQDVMDRNMSAIHGAIMGFAAPKDGERAVDIGCGTGTTTLAIAQAVGLSGQVTGVDVSRPMLALAKTRAAAAHSRAQFIEADASAYPFKCENDLVFSRFGVMFFDDPAGAFANIRKSLVPGGRLAFVCWRTPQENPWASVPLAAARPLLPPQPPADPLAPGPFAFADATRTRAILETAGFRDVRIEKLDTVMNMGVSVDAAAAQTLKIGPLSRAAGEVDEPTAAKLTAAVRTALEQFVTPAGGVAPPAGCWLVGASS